MYDSPRAVVARKYLSSYSKKCDFREFAAISGEISPQGSMSPPTCKFYMYPTTHSILNPVPSSTWILENVAILKFPLIRGEISPWGPKPPLTLRI